MLAFLQQPYIFAFSLALLTATLVYLYSKTTEKDSTQVQRTFFKTLAAGTVAGIAMTYFSTARSETLSTEPFDALPTGMGGGGNPGI